MEDAHHVESIRTSRDAFIRLNYDKNKTDLVVFQDLLLEKFKTQMIPTDTIAQRLCKMLCIIETNLTVFQCFFKHVDTVHTVIQYLQYACSEVTDKFEFIMPLLFTIFDITNNPHVNYTLLSSVMMHTKLTQDMLSDYSDIFIRYTTDISFYQRHEIIILEDSDLYAVIKYLQRSDHLYYLKRIWVHEVIHSKFRWLLDYYNIIWNELSVFQLKQELVSNICNTDTTGVISMISIWSKNIVDAKVFARSLNATVIFINAHMNFYTNMIIFPYSKLQFEDLQINKWTFHLDDSTVISHNCAELTSNEQYCNLYYNGKWQKPANDTYWLHEDKIWANATKNDFIRCMGSAKKGFESWRTTSVHVKTSILFDFVSAVERAGNIGLSCLLSNWIYTAAEYNTNMSWLSSPNTVEVTTINNPRGIMLLHERSKLVLFRKLIFTLMTGNTVIVLITRNSYTSVAPYFNMFLTGTMPLGVVNLLSSTMKLDDIKSRFCMISQTSEHNLEIEMDEIFKQNDKIDETCMNLTIPMFIIHPLK